MGRHGIGKLYGQEKNITTYNLARMNMLLHGVKDTEFEIHHGDSLENDWDILREPNPARKIEFDAVVANPPFSYRWNPSEEMAKDFLYEKGKRQNVLLPEHIEKIVDTYQHRREVKEELPNGSLFASRRVSMEEIEENDFNLNISRYVSIAKPEKEIDLNVVHSQLVELHKKVKAAAQKHNSYLKELGLPTLPYDGDPEQPNHDGKET